MKLGIAYNIFDGQEMLPFALKNLRPYAHRIFVIYQKVSNFGNENPNLLPVLEKCKELGWIDKLIEYEPELHFNDDGSPKWGNGALNEIQKRQLGLEVCRLNGCDTYMTLDCDELYDHTQFEWAMKEFERGGYDTSWTNLLTFYKLPTMQILPPETWFQPLFYKIKPETKFEFIKEYPVYADWTKRVKSGHLKVFAREEIQQYHYAYVRHHLIDKVKNSTAQSEIEDGQKVIDHYDNWKGIEDGALTIGLHKHKLKEVKNKFAIDINNLYEPSICLSNE